MYLILRSRGFMFSCHSEEHSKRQEQGLLSESQAWLVTVSLLSFPFPSALGRSEKLAGHRSNLHHPKHSVGGSWWECPGLQSSLRSYCRGTSDDGRNVWLAQSLESQSRSWRVAPEQHTLKVTEDVLCRFQPFSHDLVECRFKRWRLVFKKA